MNSIGAVFQKLKSQGRKALIPYVTVGDPSPTTSKAIIFQLIENGADLIELGVPFSDPTADGPIIQAASERALKTGVNLADVLGMVKEIRVFSPIPIILFGYYNPIFAFGAEAFCREAKNAGVDGLLVVDLPYEEVEELKEHADPQGLDMISLIAPTSGAERIRIISRKARGFLYYISMTGVTGAELSCRDDLENNLRQIRSQTDLPVVIGFGISTPEQAREMAGLADGVVVGSALVRIIGENPEAPDLPQKIGQFLAGFRQVL